MEVIAVVGMTLLVGAPMWWVAHTLFNGADACIDLADKLS